MGDFTGPVPGNIPLRLETVERHPKDNERYSKSHKQIQEEQQQQAKKADNQDEVLDVIYAPEPDQLEELPPSGEGPRMEAASSIMSTDSSRSRGCCQNKAYIMSNSIIEGNKGRRGRKGKKRLKRQSK